LVKTRAIDTLDGGFPPLEPGGKTDTSAKKQASVAYSTASGSTGSPSTVT
jgi:hypothetical protein